MPRETVVDPAQTNFHNWFDDVCDLVFGDEAALNQLVKSEEAMDRPEGPVNVNDEVQGSQWAHQGWEDLKVALGPTTKMMVVQKPAEVHAAQSTSMGNLNSNSHSRRMGLGKDVDAMLDATDATEHVRVEALETNVVQQSLCSAH